MGHKLGSIRYAGFSGELNFWNFLTENFGITKLQAPVSLMNNSFNKLRNHNYFSIRATKIVSFWSTNRFFNSSRGHKNCVTWLLVKKI